MTMTIIIPVFCHHVERGCLVTKDKAAPHVARFKGFDHLVVTGDGLVISFHLSENATLVVKRRTVHRITGIWVLDHPVVSAQRLFVIVLHMEYGSLAD